MIQLSHCFPFLALLCLIMSSSQPSMALAMPLTENIRKRLAMGEKPNALIHTNSPYLLQHAFNPVNWYPWGEEALARAKKENKPIFLSIGYSTCHWCHVMAHESFENPEIAALINQWFIPIKVDREERPDIDQLYMAATQAMTGSGGWPLSAFLFPDGRPFFTGTYFPPTSKMGRPGFTDLLQSIHRAWQGQQEQLDALAQRVMSSLDQRQNSADSKLPGADELIQQCYTLLSKSYDHTYGGFGRAPKFPRPVVFNFLFDYWAQQSDKTIPAMALKTLDQMAAGGLYDHIGGGFHRYSVDEQWRIPHFEKMLYDQAQLVSSYIAAFQASGQPHYQRIAEETLNYVLRDLRDAQGGFYSAEDADSDDPYHPGGHGEGAFYLWTEKDLRATLPPTHVALFLQAFGVKADGNALSDPMQEFTGRNILYRARTDADLAQQHQQPILTIQQQLQKAQAQLLAKRNQRTRPHLDDKIITAWNGLMISALAQAGLQLQKPAYTQAAEQAATFIHDHLYDQKTQQLQRRYRHGKAGLVGQLDDYAFLIAGLLDLYQATQTPLYLTWSLALMDTQIQQFSDQEQGGFFDAAADKNLLLRLKDSYDGAEPAANSVSVNNLVRLAELTNNADFKIQAEQTIQAFSESLTQYPPGLLNLLPALRKLQQKGEQLIIVGPKERADTQQLWQIAHQGFQPNRLVLLADGEDNQALLNQYHPAMQHMKMVNHQATAYLCQDFSCQTPVNNPSQLQQMLNPTPLKKP